VQYFAKRPQVQERLTMQIGNELTSLLETKDVAVIVDAEHLCVSSRGIEDTSSSTVTSFYSGRFEESDTKREFLTYVYNK
jgi:GTP cyclohydrolase I